MVLDFPEKKITLQGHQLPLHHEEEGSVDSPDTVKVQWLEELNLPPRTEALIAVRIAARTYLVEPLDQPREASCPSVSITLTVVKNRMGYIQVANMESASLLLPKNNTTTGRATIMGKTVLSMALPSGIEDVPQDVKQKRPVASQREDAISEFSERVRAPLLHQIWPHRANDHRST